MPGDIADIDIADAARFLRRPAIEDGDPFSPSAERSTSDMKNEMELSRACTRPGASNDARL